jgi:ATP-dependent Lhr-like helicase
MRRDLRGLGYVVRAHHGSLDREEREAAEAAVRGESRIVLFATSTLEIGIDIGDIDLVVLDGPAPDIPALLQRIGRGNRRSGTTRVMTCAESLLDVLVHAAMLEAARDGWLGPDERGPQHAVARQQVASYILQARRISRARGKVQGLLDRCAEPVVAGRLLDGMVAREELLEDARGLRLGEEWLDRLGRGEIHSTIEEPPGVTVEDEETGQKIASGVAFQRGRGLRAAGHLLEVRRWSDFKLEVRRVSDERLARGEWGYRSRPWLKGAGQPQAVRRYLGLAEDQWPVIPAGDGETLYVFHFGGARRRAVLELLAAQSPDAPGPDAIDEWLLLLPISLTHPTRKPDWLTQGNRAALDGAIAARLSRLERVLGRPQANRALPFAARLDEVRGWLRLDEELARLRDATWTTAHEPEVEAILRALGATIVAEDDEAGWPVAEAAPD